MAQYADYQYQQQYAQQGQAQAAQGQTQQYDQAQAQQQYAQQYAQQQQGQGDQQQQQQYAQQQHGQQQGQAQQYGQAQQGYNQQAAGDPYAAEKEMAEKYQEFIETAEERDGIRFSWNNFPANRIEGTRNVVPLAMLYTPLSRRPNMPPMNYGPILCQVSGCKCVLNPYCRVDYNNRVWSCVFCAHRNPFPQSYASMTAEHKPAELHEQYSTIEYKLNPRPGQTSATLPPPIFLFAIDTCLKDDELDNLKSSIITSLGLLPQNSLVGIITFGKMVQLHELDQNSPIPKSYVFRGTKDISSKQLKDMLQLGRQMTPQQANAEQNNPQGHFCKFLQPVGQIEMYVNTLIEEIQMDPWPVAQGKRPNRCTGVALSIAVGLLEATYPNSSARVLAFLSGPCTLGPGLVIDTDRSNTIRTWHDIDKDNARHVKKAIKHYKNIAVRAASSGHAIDIFAACLDQTGIHEMKTLCTSTGGHLFMCDSFQSSLFSQTYQKMFQTEDDQFEMGFNATMEIKCSKELKLQGVIGSCVSLNIKAAHVADEEIGVGGTSQYRICALDPNTTYGVYLQVANPSNNQLPPNTNGYIQFATNYIHADGTRRVRVTTVARPFSDPADTTSLTNGFDQEAAAVLIARYASYRCEREEPPQDVLRWLDRTLIRLCQKFGQYNQNNPESFRFPTTIQEFPQFMFHLRRTGFLNVFGHSPDETAYRRYQLCKQNMSECITMIQPQLYSYSFDGPPKDVTLDSANIQPNTILLLDTFNQVLIYYGKDIHAWKEAGYHEKPEYENLKRLLEAPVEDAREIIASRFPIPRYIETTEGGSQARFLLAKVNVSKNHNTQDWNQSGGATVLSDDVNLQNFVDHLKKLAVNPT